MIRVAQPADPLEAQLLLGVLEEHGIRAVVQGEALWAARGELPLTPDSAPSIWVADEADAHRAREIIEEHKTRPNPTHCPNCGMDLHGGRESQCPKCATPFRIVGVWTCPVCHEISGTQFTHCWSCGAERGDTPETGSIPSGGTDSSVACPRCNGTGEIERTLMPATFIICGFFLAFAAFHNLADASSHGVWSVRFLLGRLLYAIVAVLCIYFARRVRHTPCSCREDYV